MVLQAVGTVFPDILADYIKCPDHGRPGTDSVQRCLQAYNIPAGLCCRYDDDGLLSHPYEYEDYDDLHTGHGWQGDSFFRPPQVPEQAYVWLDPHILANPAIADIDGDGQEELVLAVSYFFDRDQYNRPVSYPSPINPSRPMSHHYNQFEVTLAPSSNMLFTCCCLASPPPPHPPIITTYLKSR